MGAVREFESAFAEKLGVRAAIAVNSGTAALAACMMSMKMTQRDTVVTSPFTFIATANAILFAGATPVFADVTPSDLLLDPGSLRQRMRATTRAVVPVHLFGKVCDMEGVRSAAAGAVIIEDACQALGAERDGRMAGTVGDAGCFSFYRTKNLSTFEGGMIAFPTGSRLDEAAIRAIVNQGDSGGRSFHHVGFNFRMAEPLAVIGLHVLTSHWGAVLSGLGRYGVADGYYPNVVYDTPAYRNRGITGDCPIAEAAAAVVRARLGRGS